MQNLRNIETVFGKEFDSKLTGERYGVFRKYSPPLPADFSVTKFGEPIAEDCSGNLITHFHGGNICFWDHETDDLTIIAYSWEEFFDGCIVPKEVTLEPGEVKSAWIDPEFAKKFGLKVPKDGWIQKET